MTAVEAKLVVENNPIKGNASNILYIGSKFVMYTILLASCYDGCALMSSNLVEKNPINKEKPFSHWKNIDIGSQ